MIWRSGLAVLLGSALVLVGLASLQGEGNFETELGLHDWGQPQTVETARQELNGAWAEEVPDAGDGNQFSALIFSGDRLSWYTFQTADDVITHVDGWEYTVTYQPEQIPRRLTLTSVEDPQAPAIHCVYALDGTTLKLWRGHHLFPRPTSRTPPHYLLQKSNLPE